MPAMSLYFGGCSLYRVVIGFTDSSEASKTRVHHFLFPFRISNYPEFAFKSLHLAIVINNLYHMYLS